MRAASESTIQIDFYYRNVRCRETLKLAPTIRNLNHARNLLGKIKLEIGLGTFDYLAHFPDSPRAAKFSPAARGSDTIESRLRAWLTTIASQVTTTTLIDYRRGIEHTLIPAFGATTLRDLSRAQLRNWIAGKDVSAKRLNNLLAPLRAILAEACSDDEIPVNPLAGLLVRKREKVKEGDDIDPFTPAEIGLILDGTSGHFRNLVQFAIGSGMRTSELIALRWSDVDLPGGTVTVRRARVRGTEKAPKTLAGKRTIKLLPPATHALKQQRALSRLASEFVFLNPGTGDPWEADKQIREWNWRPLLARVGVRYRYPYQTRHTYASTMLSAGENPMWVAAQMGHKDWQMIVRRYGRWIPDVAPNAGERGAAAWSGYGHDDS